MTPTQMLVQFIDLRSFSSIWYWIALLGAWTLAGQSVCGVPFDLVTRARRDGPAAEADLADAVRIGTARLARLAGDGGVVLLAIGCGTASLLLVLAVIYRIELGEALVVLVLPLGLHAALTLRNGQRLAVQPLTGAALTRRLVRERLRTQIFAATTVAVAVLWAIWRNPGLAFGG